METNKQTLKRILNPIQNANKTIIKIALKEDIEEIKSEYQSSDASLYEKIESVVPLSIKVPSEQICNQINDNNNEMEFNDTHVFN